LRKLHLALDADSGDIIAHDLTGQGMGDSSQMGPLLDQIDGPIGKFTADGAYDGDPTYDAVSRHSADAAIIIPSRANTIDRSDTGIDGQRDQYIAAINTDGRGGGKLPPAMASGPWSRPRDRPLQVDHRTPAASTLIRAQQAEVAIRLRRPQPNAGMCTPEVRPVRDNNDIVTASKSRIHSRRQRCTKAAPQR
jgi:hypothetical protein